MSDRFADTVRFYGLLDRLTKRIHAHDCCKIATAA